MNNYITLDGFKYVTPFGKWTPVMDKPATARIDLLGGLDVTYGPATWQRWQGMIEVAANPTIGYGSPNDLRATLAKRTAVAFIDHYGENYSVHLLGPFPEMSFTPVWDGDSNVIFFQLTVVGIWVPVASASLSPSASISPSSSVSKSTSPSASSSVSPSASASMSPSVSLSISPSGSLSPSASRSPSMSYSPSGSRSVSPSVSPSESVSVSPSESPSSSTSISVSPSESPSSSISKSVSPSASKSASPSVSVSESPSLSLSEPP